MILRFEQLSRDKIFREEKSPNLVTAMPKSPQAYQEWLKIVFKKMPHLTKSQAIGLAMWSFAIAITHSCGLSTVTVFLAQILTRKENNVREQLRQWYRETNQKYGRKRQQIEVSQSFKPLLSWVLSWWSKEEKSIVLAADASHLGQRFTLLVISVVYRGSGIPVAWKIIKGTEKGSWKPYWLELLEHLEDAIDDDWLVIVTTDRGLYASWFYEAIVNLGWHPMMRINHQGYYQEANCPRWMPLSKLITQVGQSYCQRVNCFQTNSVDCTLVASWESGYADPWLVLSDLSPSEVQIYWYGMRSWIECLFKDIKRGGFGWHHTKITEPKRAERLWLAIAVATLWLVSVGGQSKTNLSVSSLSVTHQTALPEPIELNFPSTKKPTGFPLNQPTRYLSCFRRGFLTILANIIRQMPLPTGCFIPPFSLSSA